MSRLVTTILAVIATCCVCTLSTSCTILPDPDKTIKVDRPETFTRERLLSRRIREKSNLESKLAEEYEPTFSGYRQVQSFEGFMNRLDAKFDPLGGKVTTLDQTLRIDDLQQKVELNKLHNEIELLRAERSVQAFKNDNPSSPITYTNPSTLDPKGKLDYEAFRQASDARADGIFGLTPDKKRAPELPGVEVTATKAKLSAIEALRDEMAYREFINSAMLEHELDDTHDLFGSTIYTFKFDVAILPDRKVSDLAKLQCEVNPVPYDANALYDGWLRHLEGELNKESLSLQRKARNGNLSHGERIELIEQVHRALTYANINKLPALQNQATTTLSTIDNEKFADIVPGTGKSQFDASNIVNEIVRIKYGAKLARFATLTSTQMNGYYVISVNGSPDMQADFSSKLSGRERDELYLYNIQPKELAQNVSDVAASENLRNYILSAGAFLPQYGVSANNYADYITRSQEKQHAILRRPLIVGYGFQNNADDMKSVTFGWIFGPRFEIEDSEVSFRHIQVQHSVEASLVVPGWVQRLDFTVNRSWERERAAEIWQWRKWLGCDKKKTGGDFSVSLPVDYDAITKVLIHQPAVNLPPIIYVESDRPDGIHHNLWGGVSRPQQILVRGRDLWRDPQVYVGSQKADLVELLRDMDGVLATFNSVTIPANAKDGVARADLRVVTSHGSALLENAVLIRKMQEVQTQKLVSAHGVDFAISGTPIAFPFIAAPLTDFDTLTARHRLKNTAQAWADATGTTIGQGGKAVVFTFTAPADEFYTIDVMRKRNPYEDQESILLNAPVTLPVFAASDNRKFKATAQPSVTVANTAELTIKIDPVSSNRDVFLAAYPGLKEAVEAGKLFFVLQKKGDNKEYRMKVTGDQLNNLQIDWDEIDDQGLLPKSPAAAIDLEITSSYLEFVGSDGKSKRVPFTTIAKITRNP